MKKLMFLLIFALCAAASFAQNVKPYSVDLSRIPAASEDKTATYDKTSRTMIIKAAKGQRGLSLWFGENGLDISNYNIIRIKYKNLGEVGFQIATNYEDSSISWERKVNYCPSNLNEMVIPLIPGQKKIKDFWFEGTYNTDYPVKVVFDSISFEKVSNPEKTDIFKSNESPVIDTAKTENIDSKISSWDYVKKLGVGINYYVFECWPGEPEWGMDYYVSSRHKKPTKELIHTMKERGFKTIRLQTCPNSGHLIDTEYTIDQGFIKAIKQVVDWAIEEDMYVILCGPKIEILKSDFFRKRISEDDVHYAGIDVNEAYKKKSEELIKAIWKQYATAFNNSYDEHLIFEALNEPVDIFHEHAWGAKTDCSVCKKDFAVLNSYNQAFLDTIRSTGGNNSKRFIMVGGLGEGWKSITVNLFKLPKDKIKDRLIPTVHIYPMGYPPAKKYYTESIKKASVTDPFAALDKCYFAKKIPVYIGETGHSRNSPILDRIDSIKDLMKAATAKNRSCSVAIWNCPINDDVAFSYLEEKDLKWQDNEYIDTILSIAEGKEYPLSEDFIKKNEVKIPSIVGKNLLNKPVEIKKGDDSYCIDSDLLIRSVPSKYKLEFTIQKMDANTILFPGFADASGIWHDLVKEKNINLTGGSVKDGWCIAVKDEILTITVDEKLAAALESSRGIVLQGENIIIKSVKVIE